MEGLIPFVIHAIKKNKERSAYLHLSDDSNHAGLLRPDKEGSSRHRRTRSEFQPRPQGSDYLHGGGGGGDLQRRGLAPSRSLREGALPSTLANGGAGRW